MYYKVFYQNPLTRLIEFEIRISNHVGQVLEMRLPDWRPGRYMLQNFARNVQKFLAFDSEGNQLISRKVNHFTWQIQTQGIAEIVVKYSYFANQLDAGGCYLQSDLLYINWICCAMSALGHEKETCEVEVLIPQDFKIATPLERQSNKLTARDFEHLVDSPMIASPTLVSYGFWAEDVEIYCYFYGKIDIPFENIQKHFPSFISAQKQVFGVLPIERYHFIYLILPYKFYHGVEHADSTVIVLGPDTEFLSQAMQADFFGVSSHEFFHLWNVKRLRPKELLPYNLYAPAYFQTGFVVEGITTYYGDLILARAGYFNFYDLCREINFRFAKHFSNLGRFNSSLADSSIDLWIDGYTAKAPGKGVSIYDKGMIVALILDMELRRATQNKCSLDDLMRCLWQKYEKTGYSLEDFMTTTDEVAGKSMKWFFDTLIMGSQPVEPFLSSALQVIGCKLSSSYDPNPLQTLFGAKVALDRFGSWEVVSTTPGSPAERSLSTGDILHSFSGIKLDEETDLVALFGKSSSLCLTVIRNFELVNVELKTDGNQYFPTYVIEIDPQATEEQRKEFSRWCGLKWPL